MSKSRELIKNTAIISLGKISTQIISFFLLPLYTSRIPTDEYGNFDYIVTIAAFALPVVTMLMEESMFRFLIDAKDKEEKRSIISQTFLYSLTSTIIISVLFAFFSVITQYELAFPMWIYSIALLSTALSNALSRGEGKIALYSLSNFIASISTIVLNLIFILGFHWGAKALISSIVVAHLLASSIVFVNLKVWKLIDVHRWNPTLLKTMLKYSFPLVPNTISWSIINTSDRLVIMNVLGASANGLYSMSYKFPHIINSFYSYFIIAWRESSAKMARDDDFTSLNRIYRLSTVMLFSITVCMITGIRLIYPFFINENYKSSVVYVPIIAISVFYASIAGFYGGIFAAYKDTRVLGITSLSAAIINLLVDIALIHSIGIYAAAISTFASSYYLYIYRKITIRKYVRIQDEINVAFFIAFVVALAVFYYDNKNVTIVAFVISVIVSIVINWKTINAMLNFIIGKMFRKKEKKPELFT